VIVIARYGCGDTVELTVTLSQGEEEARLPTSDKARVECWNYGLKLSAKAECTYLVREQHLTRSSSHCSTVSRHMIQRITRPTALQMKSRRSGYPLRRFGRRLFGCTWCILGFVRRYVMATYRSTSLTAGSAAWVASWRKSSICRAISIPTTAVNCFWLFVASNTCPQRPPASGWASFVAVMFASMEALNQVQAVRRGHNAITLSSCHS
jgi:hypothetical protein